MSNLEFRYQIIVAESQGVSPFPAGDHKAHINRHSQRHSKHKTELEDLKVLKRSPDLLNNIKKGQGQLII